MTAASMIKMTPIAGIIPIKPLTVVQTAMLIMTAIFVTAMTAAIPPPSVIPRRTQPGLTRQDFVGRQIGVCQP